MLSILTSFDGYLPLASLISNGSKKVYIPLYVKGTGLKLEKIWNNISKIKNILESHSVFVNDFKSHIKAFGLDNRVDYKVYDAGLLDVGPSKKELLEYNFVCGNDKYRNLIANVSVIYQGLEDRGVYYGYKHVFPKYALNTSTGRSKTTEFNIQGTTGEFDIRHVDSSLCYFVHFDWVSVDLFMVAVISGDNDLLDMFSESDPYSIISKSLNISRNECKRELFSALYSLNVNHPIFMLFPVLKGWMTDCIIKIEENGFAESLLGRRFFIKGDNKLGVFNSQFQGSVVHALHNVMIRSFEDYSYYLLTEMHDSLVFACNKNLLPDLINDIGKLMLYPFDDRNIRMPFVVSVGNRWRHWKVYKTVR